MRRAAHGVFKTLVDLPTLTGVRAPVVQRLFDAARSNFSDDAWNVEKAIRFSVFMVERF